MAFKEIVTKAVIGKGKKKYINSYELETDNDISTVLGCWVINHKFKGYEQLDKIIIEGSFDVNVWYSYDNNSKTTVITKNISYNEPVMVNVKEQSDSKNKDIIVRSLKQPTCTSAILNNKLIKIDIEKELGIEIVGDTKVRIDTLEDDDNWEIITDPKEEEDLVNEIDNVKENYLDEEK